MSRSGLKQLMLILFVLVHCACSQSGKRPRHQTGDRPDTHSRVSKTALNVVKMRKVSGVYEIPTEINGETMYFIFDTGAGMISISNTEALFLYKQGTLTNEDIVGNAKFTDANGDVSDGLVIRLKSVKIGSRTLQDIEASVVPNLKAPLLFGQSALEKFGRVSIDYKHGEIIFE